MARLSGRPLLDTRADVALFVDREHESARLRRALDEGLNVLVTGPRGCGKTSFVRRVLTDLRAADAAGPTPVFVVAATVERPADLLRRVAGALDVTADGSESARDVVAALAQADLGGPRPVVVDGLPVATAHPVFGQLRDELWALPITWVVTCPDRDEPDFLRPPADAFFDVVLRLGPLADGAVRELLRRRATPAELDDRAVAEIVSLAGGSPRKALDLARRLLTDPAAADGLRAEVLQRRDVLESLGPAAAMLLDELETSGPASASDPALLARLGWTRPRAAQVLAELEQAGLVEGTTVPEGPGRPRKVYRSTAGTAGAGRPADEVPGGAPGGAPPG